MIAEGLRHIATIDAQKTVSQADLEAANEAFCKKAHAGMQSILAGALFKRSMLMLNRFDMSDH